MFGITIWNSRISKHHVYEILSRGYCPKDIYQNKTLFVAWYHTFEGSVRAYLALHGEWGRMMLWGTVKVSHFRFHYNIEEARKWWYRNYYKGPLLNRRQRVLRDERSRQCILTAERSQWKSFFIDLEKKNNMEKYLKNIDWSERQLGGGGGKTKTKLEQLVNNPMLHNNQIKTTIGGLAKRLVFKQSLLTTKPQQGRMVKREGQEG